MPGKETDDPLMTYKRAFGSWDGSKQKAALAFAADVRKFEIELYWKRAAYFWAFTAAAFGSYLAVLGAEHLKNKAPALLLVSCLGLVFSTAWYCVNRASKYWQLNWEMHVDLLEDEEMGPLYKTVLHDPSPLWHIAGPYPFSVSKINQLLSLFVVAIFGLLLASTLDEYYMASRHPELLPTGCLAATASCIILFWAAGRVGNKNKLKVSAIRRRTILVKFDESQPS